MKFRTLSAAILLAASTSVHASTSASEDVASNTFPRAQHYLGIQAPEAPLASSLSELRKQAASRGPSAYAAIYAGLSKCRALRGYGPAETALDYCSGVPESEITDAGAWLETAAALGDEGAMYVFSVAGGQDLRKSPVAAQSKAALSDYRQRAAGYLDKLAERCNVDAIDAIYRQKVTGGLIFAKDLKGAYLLQRELDELYPGLITPDERVRLANSLSSADTIQASSDARSFLDSRCR